MLTTSFRARRLDSDWQTVFNEYWPAYESWYRRGKKSEINPQALKQAQRQLKMVMPEMLPLYEGFLEASNDCPVMAQFLTGYQPPAYLLNCSQAVILDREPVLIRNYDLSPDFSENLVTQSDWQEQEVIGSNECLWGLNDGMNRSGLAISITFGGSNRVGEGFGIPFILRYLLQTCETVAQAIKLLQRVPSHMAYNVTLLDKRGSFATVLLAPGKTAIVVRERCTTNHQGTVTWPAQAAFTQTLERKRFLDELLSRKSLNDKQLLEAFLNAPLHNSNFAQRFGTVYTAVYKPSSQTMSYHWPAEQAWQHGFSDFRTTEKTVTLGRQPGQAKAQDKTLESHNLEHGITADIRRQLLHGLRYLPAGMVGQPDALQTLMRKLDMDSHIDWKDYATLMAEVWRYPVCSGYTEISP